MKVGLLVDITKDYEGSLRHAKELGFDRGQLAIWDMGFYTEENLQALKKLLKELDFTVTDLWCGWSGPMNWFYPEMYNTIGLAPEAYRARRVEDLRRGARFAYELGVKNVVTHLGYVPDNPFDKDHRGVVEALRAHDLLGKGYVASQDFTQPSGTEWLESGATYVDVFYDYNALARGAYDTIMEHEKNGTELPEQVMINPSVWTKENASEFGK